jgi:transcription initiation factor TFIIB
MDWDGKQDTKEKVIELVRGRKLEGDTYGEIKDLVRGEYGEEITRNFIYYHTKDLTRRREGRDLDGERLISLVRERRNAGVSYSAIIEEAREDYGKEITRNFIYYHTKGGGAPEGTVPAASGEKEEALQGESSPRVILERGSEESVPPSPELEEEDRKESEVELGGASEEPPRESKKSAKNIYNEIDKEVVRLRDKGKRYAQIIDIVKEEYDKKISRSFIYTRVKDAEKEAELKGERKGKDPRKKPKIDFDRDLMCEACGSRLVRDESRGELTCSDCGLVARERAIDLGPEWRVFDASDTSKIRTGAPRKVSLFDMGLSTDFYPYGRDARGSPLSAKNRARFKRWRKWNNRNRITNSDNRNFSRAFNELDKICSQLHIPRGAKEAAAMLYRKARKAGVTKGCSINGMITACVYAVCRLWKIPKTRRDILAASPVEDRQELGTCFKRLLKLDVDIPTTEPQDYITKYTSELGLPQKVATNARKLLDLVGDTKIAVGRNPMGVAAAALYIVSKKSNVPATQGDFSSICNITEVTIRQRCNEIAETFNIPL